MTKRRILMKSTRKCKFIAIIFLLGIFSMAVPAMIIRLGNTARLWYNFGRDNSDILAVLRKLDDPVGDTDLGHFFKGVLADASTWEFDFSGVSKRRFGRRFSEITSFDPEGRNMDFFNPVNYSGDVMVVFEDYGAGIFERFLLEHRVSVKMRGIVFFEVDGVILKNTTTFTTSPDHNYPFKEPYFRPDKPTLNSGYYVTFPVPYQHSIRVMVRLIERPKLTENQMWEKIRKCKQNKRPCPVRAYFGITCNKLVHGVKLKTNFHDYFPSKSNITRITNLQKVNNIVSNMSREPEKYVPGMGSNCELTCQKIHPGNEMTIFSADVGQVIQSLLFRVYDEKEGKFDISKHLGGILISMTWDGKDSQVKDIPLAGFFTVGMGYLRRVNGLMAGMKKRKCSTRVKDASVSGLPMLDWLAYLYYEMPFWKSARIVVKRPRGLNPAVVCTMINTKQMDTTAYNPRLTGYFSAQLNRYETLCRDGYKTLLHVKNEWGHVVAINLFANAQGGCEENDVIIETENAVAPVFSGTGLEDYFGYVHAFKKVRNTSSIFIGVPYYFRDGEKQFMYMYRQMILDPVLYTKHIRIYMEGKSSRQGFMNPRLFEKGSSSFNGNMSDKTILSVTIFYGRKGPGSITTDKHVYESDLNFSSSSQLHNVHYVPKEIDVYQVRSSFENQPSVLYVKHVLSLKVKQRVTHTFKIAKNNVGVILRREYRSIVPNQKAKVEVDGEYAGIWYCPQRAYTARCSLRIDDYSIHPRLTVGKDTINVTFEAITLWESCSIEVITVIL